MLHHYIIIEPTILGKIFRKSNKYKNQQNEKQNRKIWYNWTGKEKFDIFFESFANFLVALDHAFIQI